MSFIRFLGTAGRAVISAQAPFCWPQEAIPIKRGPKSLHSSVKFLSDGRFEVLDTSYNGTFYENAALPNGVATVVKAGRWLVIGEADNVLELKAD